MTEKADDVQIKDKNVIFKNLQESHSDCTLSI